MARQRANILDNDAEMEVSEHPWGVKPRVAASLVDHMRRPPKMGNLKCVTEYSLTPREFKMSVAVKGLPTGQGVAFVFPVATKPGELVKRTPQGSVRIHKAGGVVEACSSSGFQDGSAEARIFSYVPGIACVPLTVVFSRSTELTLCVLAG